MRARRPLHRRIVRKIFRDVEQLAEVVAETIERLDADGRSDIARPLEAALVRLAGTR